MPPTCPPFNPSRRPQFVRDDLQLAPPLQLKSLNHVGEFLRMLPVKPHWGWPSQPQLPRRKAPGMPLSKASSA